MWEWTGVFRTEYTDPPILSGYSLQEVECTAHKGECHVTSSIYPTTIKR